ncbi:hypothetical protein VTO73DRAFT_14017 [Trametes versicolor]
MSEGKGGEQTYNEVRTIWEGMKAADISRKPKSIMSHRGLSNKIKGACKKAREAGYTLIWIDSACIDKSSSAELAEAINSMYDLYRLADVCYVYLVDMPDRPELDGEAFRSSRWHRRGWTLQELLAPKEVVFLNAAWMFLGTKCSLADLLCSATRIDTDILLGVASISSASVARRMSWAASRETTRVEDEAYSLLGIFGVHLSPIYGEGGNAFLRLQEEIIKTIPDQSIFAWGRRCVLLSLNAVKPDSPAGIHYKDTGPTGLLAASPVDFVNAKDIRPLSPTDYSAILMGIKRYSGFGVAVQNLEIPSLHSVISPEGVRIKVLTVDMTQLPTTTTSIISQPSGSTRDTKYHNCLALLGGHRTQTLAVLRCTDEAEDNGLITLALFHPPSGTDGRTLGLPIATHEKCGDPSCTTSPSFRVVTLNRTALDSLRNYISPAPSELSLLRHSAASAPTHATAGSTRHLYSIFEMYPFRLPFGKPDSGGSPRIQLAPSCQGNLRVLGYSASKLSYGLSYGSHSGTTVVGKTSIFRSSVPGKDDSMPEIRITITLESHSESVNVDVHFAISTIVHVAPSAHNRNSLNQASCSICKRPGCRTEERVPTVDRFTSHTSSISAYIPLRKREVATADLLLPHPLGSVRVIRHEDEYCRILRLSLECPMEHRSGRPPQTQRTNIPDLWLAIDLSGRVPNPEWLRP